MSTGQTSESKETNSPTMTTAQMHTTSGLITSSTKGFHPNLTSSTSTKIATQMSSKAAQERTTSMPLLSTSISLSNNNNHNNNNSINGNQSKTLNSSSITISLIPESTTLSTSSTTSACQDITTIFAYSAEDIYQLTSEERNILRGLCWETMFGQEIAKIMFMDLVFTIGSTVAFDFGRALFVRYLQIDHKNSPYT